MLRPTKAVTSVFALLTIAATAPFSTAGPPQTAEHAWSKYIAATEARIEAELASSGRFLTADFSADSVATREAIAKGAVPIIKMATVDKAGKSITVPDATVAHWRGAVFLRGISLDSLLHRLQHPDEHGAYPDDVLSLRVLRREPDALTLAMRLTRQSIVTVTYDTEHAVTYRHWGADRAASKSVSTRIAEIANAGSSTERVVSVGDDRGLLWKMNSYWRFQQVAGGVIIELESLTLSRGVPLGLGRIVEPIIDRIARESMNRTLVSMRQLHGVARTTVELP